MRTASITSILGAALAVTFLPAAEGKIPVWMPTVFGQPGHYVLTRDVMASAGPVITIMADGVTLDLNGHTIGSTDTTQPVIQIGGSSGAEKGIVIIGGKVQGGLHGILYSPPADDGKPLSLADLTISGSTEAGVKAIGFSKLEAQGIIIVNSLVGFDLQASTPPDPIAPSATIRGAAIRAGGGIHCTGVTCSIHGLSFEYDPPSAAPATPAVRFSGATGGEAVGIIIINSLPAGSIVPRTLEVVASSGIRIVNTKVHWSGPLSGIQSCILVDPMSRDFIIDDGDLTGCTGHGIHATGANGRISRMFISRAGGHGIFAVGTNFIIDDGKFSNNAGAGIWFETGGHVYRNNVLRGNVIGGVDGPGLSDSTDAGGNVE